LKKLLPLCLALMLILTGCWDKVEIDKRAFVLGAAADVAPESNENKGMEDMEGYNANPFMLTLEMPVFRSMISQNSGSGGGGSSGQAKPAWTYSSTGTSFFEIERQMATRSDRVLFFGHQKVLIIGKELAERHNLLDVLDFWARDPESTRCIKVLIADGLAKDILSAQPQMAQSASTFIADQLQQGAKTARFIDTDLCDFLHKLGDGSSMLTGRISISEDKDIKIAGSGVIKDGKLLGWLGEQETRAAQFVMGQIKGGEVVVRDPRDRTGTMTFEMYNERTQLKAEFEGKRPSIEIEIRTEGNIAEANSGSTADEAYIAACEQAVSEELEKEIKATLDKLQKQYKADVLGFGSYLEKHHNKEWKGIEKEWDDIYESMPVSVDVEVNIRRIGMKY
jgi:Ger(x)C family germination protein